ncbi:MAG: hypothetical protein Phyf2KO_18660 [Phycisphaerales bacterium]
MRMFTLACFLLLTAGSARGQVTFTSLFFIDDEVLDQAPGTTVSALYRRRPLNDSGEIIFRADIVRESASGGSDIAVLRHTPSSGLTTLLSEGDQAFGLPNSVEYDSVDYIQKKNSGGYVLEVATLRGQGIVDSNNRIAYLNHPKGERLILARSGDQMPSMPDGVLFDRATPTDVNKNGTAILSASIRGPGVFNSNDSLLSVSDGISQTVLSREGEQAPLLPSGVLYSRFIDSSINNNDQIQLSVQLVGNGITDDNNEALYHSDGSGNFTLLAREGEQVPGQPAGTVYTGALTSSRLNNRGHTAFRVGLAGPSVTTGNGLVLMSNRDGGSLQPVARMGDQVSGLPDGVLYRRFGYNKPVLNNRDDILISADLSGAGVTGHNDRAITLFRSDNTIDIIAREGDLAPGFESPVEFSQLPIAYTELNDAGQVAFVSPLHDGINHFSGLFATDLSGELKLLVAEGQLFDIDDDPAVEDFRTIYQILPDISMNNHGQIAFYALFYDAPAGMFIATIPAPASAAVLTLGLLIARRSRSAPCPS